ncbi:hypothetical protein [Komagataeibacter saccharivorans]|uniref:hypothetical protein n=1 Tax=Komagataeibacter saccharivorans TaxID=265959 RepID=UPI0011AF8396|nr:hypothetical protein [Komagataeibacter saccharivorans]
MKQLAHHEFYRRFTRPYPAGVRGGSARDGDGSGGDGGVFLSHILPPGKTVARTGGQDRSGLNKPVGLRVAQGNALRHTRDGKGAVRVAKPRSGAEGRLGALAGTLSH